MAMAFDETLWSSCHRNLETAAWSLKHYCHDSVDQDELDWNPQSQELVNVLKMFHLKHLGSCPAK